MTSTHQRFEAVTFDYGNLNEWKNYFEEIKEIAKSCKTIEKFWSELKRKCDGLAFKDLQEEFDYSTVLLGGVTPDGEYKEKSLARVYAVLFGFKPENIHDLIEKLNLIEKLRRSSQPITKITLPATKIVVEETEFIRFVRSVLDKVTSILRQAENKKLIVSSDIDVEVDYYGILSDYRKLIEIIENFVNSIAKVLPNYNQKSLFVWTLDKLTYRYMTTAYPELRDKRVFESVRDVLGLDIVFSPDIEDERIKKEYEGYSYCDASIGKELVELFKMIWDAFNNEYQPVRKALSLIYPEITNFKKEFCEASAQALKRIGWKIPKFKIKSVDRYTDDFILSTEHRKYKISGILLESYKWVTSKGYWSQGKIQCNISILSALDGLSPAIFLLKDIMFDFKFIEEYDGLYLEIKPCYPYHNTVQEFW